MKTIIEMAEDVGAYVADLPLEDAVLFEVDILSGRSAKLEAFAELVRADEREACAKMCESYKTASVTTQAHAIALIFEDCIEAIRARGNT